MSTSVTLDVRAAGRLPTGSLLERSVLSNVSMASRFTIDPNAPGDVHIVDLDKAPRNADGLVEYSADFSIIKPEEMSKANGRIFFDYGNRGNMRAIQFFNDAPASNDPIAAAHAGNGYLMRRGYVVAVRLAGRSLARRRTHDNKFAVATDDGTPDYRTCSQRVYRRTE